MGNRALLSRSQNGPACGKLWDALAWVRFLSCGFNCCITPLWPLSGREEGFGWRCALYRVSLGLLNTAQSGTTLYTQSWWSCLVRGCGNVGASLIWGRSSKVESSALLETCNLLTTSPPRCPSITTSFTMLFTLRACQLTGPDMFNQHKTLRGLFPTAMGCCYLSRGVPL